MTSVVWDDRAREWLESTAAGDCAAFARLYDSYAPHALALLIRIVKNRALAEEALQDVFLELWQKAARFDASRGSAQAWIFTITRRRAVDCVRRTQRAFERETRIGLRDLEVPFDNVAEHAQQGDDARTVRAALSHLNVTQRSFLTLAYYGGHSQSEIAILTDTPLGTVKWVTRQALQALRRILSDCPVATRAPITIDLRFAFHKP